MSYKTILVHVEQSKHLAARVRIAAQIAAAENAHLIGTAVTGISHFIRDMTTAYPMDPALGPALDKLRERANAALADYEAVVRETHVASFESRVVDDDAAGGISLQARYCDLTVLGQEDPDEPSPALLSGFPEYVAISSGSPTLIVPHTATFDTLGERILIAWNASKEALQAVRGAMPFLRRAKNVDVVVYNAASRKDVYGDEPGADIALFLTRHGVTVNVLQEEIDSEIDVGNALLSLAATRGSDMLVMGCYGHSRFREMLLGGATRVVLRSMTVPVLMAH
jgi:nucleotide-binding universal stress UspA family protein